LLAIRAMFGDTMSKFLAAFGVKPEHCAHEDITSNLALVPQPIYFGSSDEIVGPDYIDLLALACIQFLDLFCSFSFR